ncbi:MAG: hypothetical protein AAGA48_32200 [Myxococcota bacterium]
MDDELLDRVRGEVGREAWEHSGLRWEAGPDSPTVRVFADALLEAGDPRGKAIVLRRRVRETGHGRDIERLRRHKASLPDPWRPPLPHLEHRPLGEMYGFTVHLGAHLEDLAPLASVLDEPEAGLFASVELLAPVQESSVVVDRLCDAPIPGLRHLNLSRIPLDGRGVRQLMRAPHLQGIVAVTVNVDWSGFAALAQGTWRLLALRLVTPTRHRRLITPSAPAPLDDAPGLQDLEVLETQGRVTELPGLADRFGLPRLHRLRLGALRSEDAQPLATSTKLPRLAKLHMDSYEGTEYGLARLIASPGLPMLETLRIDRIAVSIGEGLFEMAPLPDAHPVRLRSLARERNGSFLARESLERIARSGALGRVAELELGNCELGPGFLDALLAAPDLSRLTSLAFFGVGLRAHDLAQLDGQRLTSLDTLRLQSNPLGNDGMRVLADLPILAQLRVLKLLPNVAGLPGIEALSASPLLQRLEHLQIALPHSSGLSCLAASPRLRPRVLTIEPMDYDLADVEALAASPVLSNVEELSLSRMPVEGLPYLVESPFTKRIEVLGVGLWNAEAMRKARPWLRRARDIWPALRQVHGVPGGFWLEDR